MTFSPSQLSLSRMTSLPRPLPAAATAVTLVNSNKKKKKNTERHLTSSEMSKRASSVQSAVAAAAVKLSTVALIAKIAPETINEKMREQRSFLVLPSHQHQIDSEIRGRQTG